MLIASKCPCCECTSVKAIPAVLMPFVAYRAFGWEPVKVEGFRDLHDGMAYTTCNTYVCNICHTSFLDMRFSEWELKRLYLDYMSDKYIADRKRFEPSFEPEKVLEPRKYKDKVEAFIKDHLPERKLNILDYGSSNTKNTPFVDEQNDIELFDLGNTSPKHQYYDLITCMHVLEHDPYPIKTLQAIRLYMHEWTPLYIELPVEGNRNYWHEHINIFNLFGIQKMLKLAGLKIIKHEYIDEKPSGSMLGVLQLLCRKDINN